MTASPAMLVFMLYEKAIGCLKEAIVSIEAGKIETRWKANKRAMEIVEHLQMTLNTEQGGEVAANLDAIYGYVLRELPRVDLKNDPAPAREAVRLLEPLCESWRQIAHQGDGTGMPAVGAAEGPRSVKAARPAPPTRAAERRAQPHEAQRNGKERAVAPATPHGRLTITA
jgi:flagellar protein FliS